MLFLDRLEGIVFDACDIRGPSLLECVQKLPSMLSLFNVVQGVVIRLLLMDLPHGLRSKLVPGFGGRAQIVRQFRAQPARACRLLIDSNRGAGLVTGDRVLTRRHGV